MKRQHLVVITGAGMSAESGISTFRDNNGLWNNYKIEEVATPQAWATNPQLVLDFYNVRRVELAQSEPNKGHRLLKKLEKMFDHVSIITQNVDDLHERAGSSNILHLHGELNNIRCIGHEMTTKSIPGKKIKLGDCCENGHQYRPDIVWFGEDVPAIEEAIELTQSATCVLVIGTSLSVYPAAGLINLNENAPVFYIDPKARDNYYKNDVTLIEENASKGIEQFINEYLK